MFACQLSAALRRHGAEVRTAYLYDHVGTGRLPLLDGDLVLGGREDGLLERAPGIDPRLLGRLRAAIDDFSPDVVQVNGSRTVKYGAAARRLSVRGRRWALVYRNIGDPRQWVVGRRHRLVYQRLIMPAVDGVVAVSEGMLEGLRGLYRLGVPVVTIPTGVVVEAPTRAAAEIRAAAATATDAPVVVFVGSLTPEKRLDRLIRVIAAVRERVPGVVLWVLGEGPEGRVLTGDDLSSWVRSLGSVGAVADHLSAADVLVLTSDTEGTPAVLLEAGAAGLSVVATRVGGVPECVEHGVTGLLVAPQDEAGMADAVCSLLQDPGRRTRMGQAGRRMVTDRFAIDEVAERYLGFYERVVGSLVAPAMGRP